MPDAALELHLPQPILRVHIAEAEQGVGLVGREDVRDGVGVADDVDRRRDAGGGLRAGDLGQRAPQVEAGCGRREGDRHENRRECFQQDSTHPRIIINSQRSRLNSKRLTP